jgi:hypothetical protein
MVNGLHMNESLWQMSWEWITNAFTILNDVGDSLRMYFMGYT